MLDSLWSAVTLDVGIDLGTANTLVTVVGKGTMINVPSVVAVRKKKNWIIDWSLSFYLSFYLFIFVKDKKIKRQKDKNTKRYKNKKIQR